MPMHPPLLFGSVPIMQPTAIDNGPDLTCPIRHQKELLIDQSRCFGWVMGECIRLQLPSKHHHSENASFSHTGTRSWR